MSASSDRSHDSPGRRHPTALAMDRLMMGRLPDDERAAVMAHLEGCPPCAAGHRQRLEASHHFAAAVHARTSAAVARQVGRWGWLPWRAGRPGGFATTAVAAVAVGGLAAIVLLPRASTSPPPSPSVPVPATEAMAAPPASDPALGIKGGGSLKVFARRGDRAELVEHGRTLAPGDQIRFVLESGGLAYALVLSVDGAGKQSVYFPHGGAGSEAVPAQGRVEVPGSIVLDDAPGPERIWALFSHRPLRHADVAAALRALAGAGPAALRAAATLPVPDTVQASLLFEKKVGRP
jgi:hypothetical protein